MKYTIHKIIFLLSLVIEKLSEYMAKEKDMEKGNSLNKALKHLQEAENILNVSLEDE